MSVKITSRKQAETQYTVFVRSKTAADTRIKNQVRDLMDQQRYLAAIAIMNTIATLHTIDLDPDIGDQIEAYAAFRAANEAWLQSTFTLARSYNRLVAANTHRLFGCQSVSDV